MAMQKEPVFEAEVRRGTPTLPEFAKNSQISEDKVWELIEEGQLSARFIGDSILIMPEPQVFDRGRGFVSAAKEPEIARFAADLPEIKTDSKPETEPQHDDFIEDNHDILVFAQDALSRHALLSKELLATKDELIRLKDERIQFLSELLSEKDREIRNLNRSIEELETLRNFEPR